MKTRDGVRGTDYASPHMNDDDDDDDVSLWCSSVFYDPKKLMYKVLELKRCPLSLNLLFSGPSASTSASFQQHVRSPSSAHVQTISAWPLRLHLQDI